MEHHQRRMETSVAVHDALEHAVQMGVSLSPEQGLVLVTRHGLRDRRSITRALALLHAYTSSGALDVLPVACGHGVLKDAPSIVISYLLCDSSEEEREVLFSLCLVPTGVKLDDLQALFHDRSLTELMRAVHVWVRRGIVVVDEVMAWRVPEDVVAQIDLGTLIEDVRGVVHRHGDWCRERFGYEPWRLYEAFPAQGCMAQLWARRDELFALTRAMLPFESVAATRVLLTLAPAALSLGGRAALEDLVTHLELCLGRNVGGEEHVHLLLLKAELLLRQRGEVSESLVLLEDARHLLCDEHLAMSHHTLELCLLQRELVYQGLGRSYEERDLKTLERLAWLSAKPGVPGYLSIQTMRLSHRVHDELGHRTEALHLLEAAIGEAEALGLTESILLCKMELLNSIMFDQDLSRVNQLAIELLAAIDPAHAPRMYFMTKVLFGYALYMQGTRLGEASLQLEQAIDYLRSARDARSLTTTYQVLALCELEQERHAQALSWQESVGWPLYASVEEQESYHWWVPVLGALVYAWCGERFLTQRMMLDAQRHVARRKADRNAWIVAWVHAMVNVIWSVQEKGDVEDALMQLRAARQRRDDDEDVFFIPSIERYAERWLNAQGYTLQTFPHLIVDALDFPAQFSLNSGETVSLSRRKAMRHILGALIARHRCEATHEMLSTDEIFEAGWPGDLATMESQRARVYNTISRMRKLGLDAILVHDGDGYGLDPQCLIASQDEEAHIASAPS